MAPVARSSWILDYMRQECNAALAWAGGIIDDKDHATSPLHNNRHHTVKYQFKRSHSLTERSWLTVSFKYNDKLGDSVSVVTKGSTPNTYVLGDGQARIKAQFLDSESMKTLRNSTGSNRLKDLSTLKLSNFDLTFWYNQNAPTSPARPQLVVRGFYLVASGRTVSNLISDSPLIKAEEHKDVKYLLAGIAALLGSREKLKSVDEDNQQSQRDENSDKVDEADVALPIESSNPESATRMSSSLSQQVQSINTPISIRPIEPVSDHHLTEQKISSTAPAFQGHQYPSIAPNFNDSQFQHHYATQPQVPHGQHLQHPYHSYTPPISHLQHHSPSHHRPLYPNPPHPAFFHDPRPQQQEPPYAAITHAPHVSVSDPHPQELLPISSMPPSFQNGPIQRQQANHPVNPPLTKTTQPLYQSQVPVPSSSTHRLSTNEELSTASSSSQQQNSLPKVPDKPLSDSKMPSKAETYQKNQPKKWLHLKRSMTMVPIDQVKFLDNPLAWLPAQAGKTFPNPSLPAGPLESIFAYYNAKRSITKAPTSSMEQETQRETHKSNTDDVIGSLQQIESEYPAEYPNISKIDEPSDDDSSDALPGWHCSPTRVVERNSLPPDTPKIKKRGLKPNEMKPAPTSIEVQRNLDPQNLSDMAKSPLSMNSSPIKSSEVIPESPEQSVPQDFEIQHEHNSRSASPNLFVSASSTPRTGPDISIVSISQLHLSNSEGGNQFHQTKTASTPSKLSVNEIASSNEIDTNHRQKISPQKVMIDNNDVIQLDYERQASNSAKRINRSSNGVQMPKEMDVAAIRQLQSSDEITEIDKNNFTAATPPSTRKPRSLPWSEKDQMKNSVSVPNSSKPPSASEVDEAARNFHAAIDKARRQSAKAYTSNPTFSPQPSRLLLNEPIVPKNSSSVSPTHIKVQATRSEALFQVPKSPFENGSFQSLSQKPRANNGPIVSALRDQSNAQHGHPKRPARTSIGDENPHKKQKTAELSLSKGIENPSDSSLIGHTTEEHHVFDSEKSNPGNLLPKEQEILLQSLHPSKSATPSLTSSPSRSVLAHTDHKSKYPDIIDVDSTSDSPMRHFNHSDGASLESIPIQSVPLNPDRQKPKQKLAIDQDPVTKFVSVEHQQKTNVGLDLARKSCTDQPQQLVVADMDPLVESCDVELNQEFNTEPVLRGPTTQNTSSDEPPQNVSRRESARRSLSIFNTRSAKSTPLQQATTAQIHRSTPLRHSFGHDFPAGSGSSNSLRGSTPRAPASQQPTLASIYHEFREAYAYTGSGQQFWNTCHQMLEPQNRVLEMMYDDLLMLYVADYALYLNECWQAGEQVRSFWDWVLVNVKRLRCVKGVMTRAKLIVVVESSEMEVLALPEPLSMDIEIN